MTARSFQLYCANFRDGVRPLSLEETGAYIVLLTLMYETADGQIPDDERAIAGWLGVDLRVWRRLRKRLLDEGKLFLNGNNLANTRVAAEITRAQLRAEVRAKSGRAGGEVKAERDRKARQINDENLAPPQQLLGQPSSYIRIEDKNNNKGISIEEWSPGAAVFEIAAGLKLDAVIDSALARHREWWSSHQPQARKSAEGWDLSFVRRLEKLADDPRERAKLAKRETILAPPPLPIEGPVWWLQAAAAIASAAPVDWATWWASIKPTSEVGVVVAASEVAAERINAGQVGATAKRVTGIEFRALLTRDLAA